MLPFSSLLHFHVFFPLISPPAIPPVVSSVGKLPIDTHTPLYISLRSALCLPLSLIFDERDLDLLSPSHIVAVFHPPICKLIISYTVSPSSALWVMFFCIFSCFLSGSCGFCCVYPSNFVMWFTSLLLFAEKVESLCISNSSHL